MMFLLRLLFRFVPFVGPLGIIIGFLPRLLHLKREKAIVTASTAAGIAADPFPVANQIEIDTHVPRLQIAFWRLATGVSAAGLVVCGAQWWFVDKWRDHYKTESADNAEKYRVASLEREKFYVAYTNSQNEIADLRIRVSDASIKRQGLIAIETKQKGVIRRKKIEAERKMAPSMPIDPADILRVESTGNAGIAGAGDLPNASGLQTGAGGSPAS